MSKLAKAVMVLGLVAAGMAGLYFKIEYSGWVLLIGLLTAL